MSIHQPNGLLNPDSLYQEAIARISPDRPDLMNAARAIYEASKSLNFQDPEQGPHNSAILYVTPFGQDERLVEIPYYASLSRAGNRKPIDHFISRLMTYYVMARQPIHLYQKDVNGNLIPQDFVDEFGQILDISALRSNSYFAVDHEGKIPENMRKAIKDGVDDDQALTEATLVFADIMKARSFDEAYATYCMHRLANVMIFPEDFEGVYDEQIISHTRRFLACLYLLNKKDDLINDSAMLLAAVYRLSNLMNTGDAFRNILSTSLTTLLSAFDETSYIPEDELPQGDLEQIALDSLLYMMRNFHEPIMHIPIKGFVRTINMPAPEIDEANTREYLNRVFHFNL